jgi:hypothetical protein
MCVRVCVSVLLNIISFFLPFYVFTSTPCTRGKLIDAEACLEASLEFLDYENIGSQERTKRRHRLLLEKIPPLQFKV